MTRAKVLGATVILLLAGGILGLDLLADRPPAFRRGGEFLSRAATGSAGTGFPTPPTATSRSESPQSTVTTGSEAPARTPGRAPTASTAGAPPPGRPAAATAAGAESGESPSRQDAAAATGAAPGASPVASLPFPARPAPGSYTYAVDGEEKASFYGSRRFPERMTTLIHSASGLGPEQLVFDIYYSEDHVERAVVGYRADGVFFDYEGGSLRFGPARQTSEVDFDPPMCQIPSPVRAGLIRTGSSRARRADGSLARTEDWTVSVLGREPVTVGGTTVDTWKVQVDRRTTPGSSEKVMVRTTSWYDPERALWLRFDKMVHGERPGPGITLTYDAQLTATLVNLSPAAGPR